MHHLVRLKSFHGGAVTFNVDAVTMIRGRGEKGVRVFFSDGQELSLELDYDEFLSFMSCMCENGDHPAVVHELEVG